MEPKMLKKDPKRKRRPRQEIVAEWLKHNGSYCPRCGSTLDPINCTIEHIVPWAFGGGDEIDNILVLCDKCNRVRANRPFLGYQFEEYIKRLLNANGKYSVVTKHISVDGKIIDSDIVFERENDHGKELFVAEVSIVSSFTEKKVSQIIKRLLVLYTVMRNQSA